MGDPGGVRMSIGGDSGEVPACSMLGTMIGAGKLGTAVVAVGGYRTTLLFGGFCASMEETVTSLPG